MLFTSDETCPVFVLVTVCIMGYYGRSFSNSQSPMIDEEQVNMLQPIAMYIVPYIIL